MSDIDLVAYFERVGYDGTAEPTLAVLRSLHRLHPEAIPFENLDPFLHRPVDLGLATLQHKLLRSRRGGYCFEHNLLFMEVLKALGFAISGLAARVLWNQAEDAITPRSHMLLSVQLDSRIWLADVGFGGLTQTAPLVLEPDLEQETPHETFRIVERDGHFRMQANTGGGWRTLYRFDLQEHFPVDYAANNYFLSTNPVSHFRSSLIAARALPGLRLALSNHRLSTHLINGGSESVECTDAGELAAALQTRFGIIIPDAAAFATIAHEKLFKVKQ